MSDITETSRSAPCKHEWMNMIGHTQGDGTSYDSCMLCGWIDTRKVRRQAFEEALEIVGEDEPERPLDRINAARNQLRKQVRTKLNEKLEPLRK